MSTIIGLFMTIVFLGILPMVIGQVWKNALGDNNGILTYLNGFISILAVFEFLGVPMVLLFIPLHIQIIVYTVVFAAITIVVLLKNRKKIKLAFDVKPYLASFSKYEWIYLALFVFIIAVELYFALLYDVGGWRSDDGTYTVISSSALHDDGFFLTDTTLGTYTRDIPKKYALCGIYIFYSYISAITGFSVAIVEHTICNALFLLISYGAFYLLAKSLFGDKRENRLIFLIILSVAFLFGLYSHYSITFRLFGVIWQGKAFLATFMIPFLLAIYPRFLRLKFSWENVVFLAVVSLATISLTMGGIIAIALIPGILTLLYMISNKTVKPILTLISVELFPLICAGCYVLL